MNPDEQKLAEMHQLMDMCEQACTSAVLTIMSSTKPFLTEAQARDIVGRVGLRIAYGAQVFNMAIKPKEKS